MTIVMDKKGFTLVELMIGMVISSILAMAAYVVFLSSDWSYNVQEDVSEAQQNVRVALDRVTKDIRTAGFGLPDPPFNLGFDTDATAGDDLFLTSSMTYNNNNNAPDQITILGIGFQAAILVEQANGENLSGANYICVDDDANFLPGGAFDTNRRHISIGGTLYRELTAVPGTACSAGWQLTLANSIDRDYPDNTRVYIIQAVQYSVVGNNLASTDFTELRGTGSQTLAENIEDIQFAYGIDTDKDGDIDDDADGAAGYTDSDFLDAPTDPSNIIAIRANIVGRARDADRKVTSFQRLCFEDRSGDTTCTGAALDGFRRRALTKIIKLRNLRT